MKLIPPFRSTIHAMSLVEITIAVGLVSFCLVSLLGLFPTMLNSLRDSREKALSQRMFQTMTEDIHENPIAPGTDRIFSFDEDGFLLGITPARPGQTFRTNSPRFSGYATNNVDATIPPNSTSEVLVLSRIQLTDLIRGTTLLERPIWSAGQ